MIYLDLADIQGNIHRPYGRYGFPFARHLFFRIAPDGALDGRRFVDAVRGEVTTAQPWRKADADAEVDRVEKPHITLNIGFSYAGLRALDLPTRTLRLLPDEFIDGMHCRAPILGDVAGSAPETWDPAWREAQSAHIWISLNVGANEDGSVRAEREVLTHWLLELTETYPGVALLEGHGADGAARWQDSAALLHEFDDGRKVPCGREPFGFTDGIGDPVFLGQFADDADDQIAIGQGKIARGAYKEATSWSPLETGEFILGHADEGQELPVATQPAGFVRNGTFLVWRKLRQDVAGFSAYVDGQADLYMKVTGVSDRKQAVETLRAKMIGRWSSGIPLINAPTWAEHERLFAEHKDCIEIYLREPRDQAEELRLTRYMMLLNAFRYGEDPEGAACPLGAHIRRANPRDMLDPVVSATEGSSTLTNRRRILRRGMSYRDDTGEEGTIFIAICASIFRQFEFIQQQWMNYGLDLDAGNDTCPVVGHRAHSDKFVIPGAEDEAPFIAAGLPQFVTTGGGEYFFLPSLSALRMIAMGTVDPS